VIMVVVSPTVVVERREAIKIFLGAALKTLWQGSSF
jgi:hypothetical protein